VEDAAGWTAPIATTIAALITAANLGARVTGIGFIVFLIGSIAWSTVGYLTDQPNLLYQNILLCVINAIGIWRWLGREARYDMGAKEAARTSVREPGETLFPISRLAGGELTSASGATLGRTIDAMAACRDGRIHYVVVSEGGIGGVGERLHALRWEDLAIGADTTGTRLTAETLAQLPVLEPGDWPGQAPER
jgi:hypothetical protein